MGKTSGTKNTNYEYDSFHYKPYSMSDGGGVGGCEMLC